MNVSQTINVPLNVVQAQMMMASLWREMSKLNDQRDKMEGDQLIMNRARYTVLRSTLHTLDDAIKAGAK